ncbi:MAG: hypothetical protein AAF616_11010 [Bacteroidota bacterium]
MVLLICSVQLLKVDGQALQEARIYFHKAVLDPEQSSAFRAQMLGHGNNEAVFLAYRAVSEAMLARVMWNPFTQFNQLKKYQKGMDAAVAQSPNNVEIRFLRLAIEVNLPTFLGMSGNIDQDQETILKNIAAISSLDIDLEYGRYIFHFLQETNLFNEKELSELKAAFTSASRKLPHARSIP